MKRTKQTPQQRNSLYYLILFFILLLGIILRFAHTPDRYTFDNDGVRDAIVAYEGAKSFSFPLTGPFSSTGPYTFGPWYYISIIFFAIVFPFAYSPWILMGVVSLGTILLMADIGRLLVSKKLGLLLALITAIAPTQINIATGLSNINPVPLFATLSIWLMLKLIKKEFTHPLWYLFLGLALGFGINAHYQMAGFLILPFLLWFSVGWKKYYLPLLIFFGIFLTFIPLLLFNLQTNFHTLHGLEEMRIARERTYVPNSWTIYLFDFWVAHLQSLFFSPPFINLFLVLAFAVTFFISLLKKRPSRGLLILLALFFVNFLWLRYYWGERHDTYLSYLSPIIFILLGYTLFSLWITKYGKVLFFVFAFFLGWNMLVTDYTRIKNASVDVAWKETQLLLERYPNKNIVLYACNPYYEAHKKTLAYLLRFHYQPQAEEKKIGMISNGCEYPSTNEHDFTKRKIEEKFAHKVYPPLFPKLHEHLFFIDLSSTTSENLKKASWDLVSTKDIFNSTVNWWK